MPDVTVDTLRPVQVSVGAAGMTVRNGGNQSLYYKASNTVSAGSNDGTLTAGSSLTLAVSTWFLSAAAGGVLEVTDPPVPSGGQTSEEVAFAKQNGGTLHVKGDQNRTYRGELEGEPDIQIDTAPPAGQAAEVTVRWTATEGAKPKSFKAPGGGAVGWVGGNEPAWNTAAGAKNVAVLLVYANGEVDGVA